MSLNGTPGSAWTTRILGALLCSGVTESPRHRLARLVAEGAKPPANTAPRLTPAPAPQSQAAAVTHPDTRRTVGVRLRTANHIC